MAFFSHKNLLLFVKLKKINALFNRLFIKCNKLYKTCIAETSLVSFSIKKEEKKAKLKNSEAFCLKSWKFGLIICVPSPQILAFGSIRLQAKSEPNEESSSSF